MANIETGSIIMGWSKCQIEIGKTGASDAMSSTLKDIGTIKDRSTTLESSDGDVLEAIASGGQRVGYEEMEGSFVIKTRLIEPDKLFVELGLGTTDATKTTDTKMTTHIVGDYYSVKVTPKNKGAIGIEAPKCSVSVKPGYSEEEGHYADVTFAVLHGQADYWYKRVRTTAALT